MLLLLGTALGMTSPQRQGDKDTYDNGEDDRTADPSAGGLGRARAGPLWRRRQFVFARRQGVVGEDGVVKDSGRSWVFIYRYDGKQRELGLGRAGKRKGAVSLADARATAKQGRALLDQQPSVDPRTVWRAQPKASARTFAEAAKDYIAEKEAGWKNAKHIAQWRHTIKVYCKPLHDTPVDQIGVEDVRSILTPIWQRAPETASRVRVRIAAIIDHAMPVDSMQPNPARLLAKTIRQGEGGRQVRSSATAFWNASSAAISPPCPTGTPRPSSPGCARG